MYCSIQVPERGLTEVQTTGEKSDVDKKQTPILGVTPIVMRTSIGEGLVSVNVEVPLMNLGLAAVDIGSIVIEVQEATPDPELAGALAPPEAPPTPPAPGFLLSPKPPRDYTELRAAPSLEDKRPEPPEKEGRIHSLSAYDFDWTTVEALRRELTLRFKLEQAQARTLRFDYLIEEATKPKRYRFLITVSPPQGVESWEPIRVDEVVSGGGPEMAIVEPVEYEPGEPRARPVYLPPPIPLNAVTEVKP